MTDRSVPSALPPPPPTPSSNAGVPGVANGLPVGPAGPVEGLNASGLPVEAEGAVGNIPEPPATLGRARGHRVRQRTGAWPAGGTPRVDPNSLESVSDDVAYWIESIAKDVSGAMMDGMYAPFSARLGQSDTARYYGETLFTPDGQLDPQQWWAEYSRLGPDGLARAINGGARWRRSMGLRVSLPVSRFQPTGVGPDSSGTVPLTPASGQQPDAPTPGATPAPPSAYPQSQEET